jgi:hypothetical protein
MCQARVSAAQRLGDRGAHPATQTSLTSIEIPGNNIFRKLK